MIYSVTCQLVLFSSQNTEAHISSYERNWKYHEQM